MRKLMMLVAALVAVAVMQPASTVAQKQKGKDKKDVVTRVSDPRERDRRDRDDDDWYENRRDRDDRWQTARRGNGGGPRFCRTGSGHPVYGRQWCVTKGFGLGNNGNWDRVRWEDVIFRRPQARTNMDLGRDVLRDVLGNVVFGRLDDRRSRYGINAPLSGRWVNFDDRSVLLVNAGSFPLAELIDHNRDRRVDLVLVNFGR